MINSDDAQLAAQVAQDDEDAFLTLYDRYAGYVYALTMRILRDPNLAEEATQDTFLKIINKIGDYNRTSPFKAWIFTVAYRTAIDYKRKQKI